MELNTYGDLKKVIKSISTKQKGEKIGNVALDTVVGFIPGAEAAKTTFDFIKAAFFKPDSKKTKTWLDKLDIDDEMSKIVDDTVENGFLKTLAKSIEAESDNKPLEQDFNMNAKMVGYLKKTYSGRTISGIQENKHKITKNKMKKSQFKQLIKEEVRIILKEAEPATTQSSTSKPTTGTEKPEAQKVAGSADFTAVAKTLGVNPQQLTSAITLVKQGKALNNAQNKILADLVVNMIKTQNDKVVQDFANQVKKLEVKS